MTGLGLAAATGIVATLLAVFAVDRLLWLHERWKLRPDPTLAYVKGTPIPPLPGDFGVTDRHRLIGGEVAMRPEEVYTRPRKRKPQGKPAPGSLR